MSDRREAGYGGTVFPIDPSRGWETLKAIRHIVIDRHITRGTRGTRGQRWCERVRTGIATRRQEGRRVFAFFCDALNAHFQQKPTPSLLH